MTALFERGARSMSVDVLSTAADTPISDAVSGYSIEVMPRTAAKIESFSGFLPQGTRVYIACIDGTSWDDMVSTARRIRSEGFPVMPHFPARMLMNKSELERLLQRYREEADVRQALLLAGGLSRPKGDFENSMELLETGLFENAGFTDLHVAGHPEGNKDIDPEGSSANADDALCFKQNYSTRTDARMAIVTQFAFETGPLIAWARRIRKLGVTLPIHFGLAGTARLQTLLRFALECGVGNSIQVLQKRARDVRKLLKPIEPSDLARSLHAVKLAQPELGIDSIHIYPLGGIRASVEWARGHADDQGSVQKSVDSKP